MINCLASAPVAQGIEQRFPKPRVGGSNPSRRAYFCSANRKNRKRPGSPPGRFYTNHYTNVALSECIVHSAGGGVAHVGQDVTIDVEGEAHVSVP